MNFENLSILRDRHIDAPQVVTSAEIQFELRETMERLGLPPSLLENLAGNHERRFWGEGTEPSDAATAAAEAAHDGLPRDAAAPATSSAWLHD